MTLTITDSEHPQHGAADIKGLEPEEEAEHLFCPPQSQTHRRMYWEGSVR